MTGTIETGEALGRVFPNGKVLDNGPAWLRQIREQASERFTELGYPTTRMEEWKYTNVAPVARTQFRPGEYQLGASTAALIETLIASVHAIPLVFVNGKYCREFSNIESLPAGLKSVCQHRGIQVIEARTAGTPEADESVVEFGQIKR